MEAANTRAMTPRRRTKLALSVGGVLVFAVFVLVATARSMDVLWSFVGVGVVLAYGACAALAFRANAWRAVAVAVAAALTFAVAWVSFTYIPLVLAGLAVTAGCALRPS